MSQGIKTNVATWLFAHRVERDLASSILSLPFIAEYLWTNAPF
jgi:hypothetical protein